jgi:hypothetical protein
LNLRNTSICAGPDLPQIHFRAFEASHEIGRREFADPEDPKEYLAWHVFWVPPEARWDHLQANAKRPQIFTTMLTTGKMGDIGNLIDNAMDSSSAPMPPCSRTSCPRTMAARNSTRRCWAS